MCLGIDAVVKKDLLVTRWVAVVPSEWTSSEESINCYCFPRINLLPSNHDMLIFLFVCQQNFFARKCCQVISSFVTTYGKLAHVV